MTALTDDVIRLLGDKAPPRISQEDHDAQGRKLYPPVVDSGFHFGDKVDAEGHKLIERHDEATSAEHVADTIRAFAPEGAKLIDIVDLGGAAEIRLSVPA